LDEYYETMGTSEAVVEIDRECMTLIYIYLQAPYNAIYCTKQEVQITGDTILNENITSSDQVTLNAIVKQNFDILLNASPSLEETDPGGSAAYNIYIHNLGNGPDYVTLKISDIEDNWHSTIYLLEDDQDIKLSSTNLPWSETVRFRLDLIIPTSQITGVFSLKLNASGLGDWEEIELYTHVSRTYNLSIYGYETTEGSENDRTSLIQPFPGVSPGSKQEFVFEISNTGNTADWISISVHGMTRTISTTDGIIDGLEPTPWKVYEALGWQAYFTGVTNTQVYISELVELDLAKKIDVSNLKQPTTYYFNGDTSVQNMLIKLGIGQTIWVKLEVIVSRDHPELDSSFNNDVIEPWYLLVKCESISEEGRIKDRDPTNNVVKIKFNILLSDLELFDKIYFTEDIAKDHIITITVKIRNIGDIKVEDIPLSLYVNDVFQKSLVINKLEPNKTQFVSFSYCVYPGKNDIVVLADPDDMITEQNEDNNRIESKINIDDDKILDQIFNNEKYIMNSVPVIIIFLIIILFILQKQFKFFKKRLFKE
jgi:hypothetical protein